MSLDNWRKSTFSDGQGDNCVMVNPNIDSLADSKNPEGPRLPLSRGAVASFTGAIQAGVFAATGSR